MGLQYRKYYFGPFLYRFSRYRQHKSRFLKRGWRNVMTPNLRRLSRFYGMIFLLFGTLPAWADVLYYDVTLNSSALAAVPDNYSLFFQLTNGDGINDTNNVVTLSNFAFGAGGAAIPPAQTFGGASGDLNGGASLNDSTFFFNAILEGFQPGSISPSCWA